MKIKPVLKPQTSTAPEVYPYSPEEMLKTAFKAEQEQTRSQRRRKSKKQRKAEFRRSQGLMSIAPSTGAKKSAVEWITGALYSASSHRTQVWIGLGIAGIFGVSNALFYSGLLSSFSLALPIALIGGIAISAITTYFEVGPVVRKKSGRSALEQIWRMGSRVSKLPTVSRQAHHNPEELRDNYRKTEKRYEEGANRMRWLCIGVEVMLGLTFLGSVGTGTAALWKLLWFVASIFGTEHGVVMAIRAGEMEIPAAARAQLDQEMNRNKRLELS
jgi:hypothetical protein